MYVPEYQLLKSEGRERIERSESRRRQSLARQESSASGRLVGRPDPRGLVGYLVSRIPGSRRRIAH